MQTSSNYNCLVTRYNLSTFSVVYKHHVLNIEAFRMTCHVERSKQLKLYPKYSYFVSPEMEVRFIEHFFMHVIPSLRAAKWNLFAEKMTQVVLCVSSDDLVLSPENQRLNIIAEFQKEFPAVIAMKECLEQLTYNSIWASCIYIQFGLCWYASVTSDESVMVLFM